MREQLIEFVEFLGMSMFQLHLLVVSGIYFSIILPFFGIIFMGQEMLLKYFLGQS